MEREAFDEEAKKVREEEEAKGIAWGMMDEDAQENQEDQPDMSKNPFSLGK
jgi:hypothetical protein